MRKTITAMAVILLIIMSVLLSPFMTNTALANQDDSNILQESTRTIMALRASNNINQKFERVPYSMGTGAHCSAFVGNYMESLGFPMRSILDRPKDYSPGFAMPSGGTINQVKWLRNFSDSRGLDLYLDIPIDTLADNDFPWKDTIPEGSVLYFQTAINHNGYNQYSHAAVLLGYNAKDEPVFADFAYGMKNGPEYRRSFRDLLKMYRSGSGYDFTPSQHGVKTPDYLNVFIFDAIRASRLLWSEGGVVEPDVEFLKSLGGEIVITVNVNDGTTAIFDINGEDSHQISGNLYPVIGRLLKVNPELSSTFNESRFSEDGSFYDGETGTLYQPGGVLRRTLTPLGIFRLDSFARVAGFGGLEGYSDIAIMKTLIENQDSLVFDQITSNYTIHEVPRGTQDQEILLREQDLIVYNSEGKGALPIPLVNRSSGCVNYDKVTWQAIKGAIQPYLDQDKEVLVVFSVPNLEQSKLSSKIRPGYQMKDDPLSQLNEVSWEYYNLVDRRGFYVPAQPILWSEQVANQNRPLCRAPMSLMLHSAYGVERMKKLSEKIIEYGLKTITYRTLWQDYLEKGLCPPGDVILVTIDDPTTMYFRRIYKDMIRVFLDKGQVLTISLNTVDPQDEEAWDYMEQISDQGIEIASHTKNHFNLPSLRQASIYYEIEESYKDICLGLGQCPMTLVLPFGNGRKNKHVLAAAKNAGYKFILSIAGSDSFYLDLKETPFVFPRLAPNSIQEVPIDLLINFFNRY